MSVTAAWFAKASPLASVAGAAVLALGTLSFIHAALTVALQGAAWNLTAYSCLILAGVLVVRRVRDDSRRQNHILFWDSEIGCFRVAGIRGSFMPDRFWQGPAWVTLGLRSTESDDRTLQLVIWKSATSAPLWNELVLRLQAARSGGRAIRTRKAHEPA